MLPCAAVSGMIGYDDAAPDGSVGKGMPFLAFIDGDFDGFGTDDVEMTCDFLNAGIAWAAAVFIGAGPMTPS